MTNHKEHQTTNSPWFGNIPPNWKTKRFKYLTKPKKEFSKNGEEELLSVTEVRGIIKRREIRSDDENLSRSDDLTGYKHVKKGDLVSNIMLVWKRGLGVSSYNGIVSPAYSVFTFSDECHPEFYNYLVRSDEYITEFRKHSTGITMSRLRLYDDSFGAVFAHVPPIKEQKLITSFLDKKTDQIDRLINKIQKKIKTLQEQRITLISKCVTKGLDPNVEMKDSGVEWIGMIPKHWHLRKLKSIGKFSKGKGITKDDVVDEGFPCIRCGEIYTSYDHKFSQTKSFIKEEAIENTVQASKGVLLFTGDGETSEEIGKCVLYDGDEKINIGGGINVFSLHKDDLSSTYLCYVVNSESVVFQKSREGRGEIVVHIYSKQLREIQIALPPIKEQKQIISHLDKAINAIDKTISLEAQRINLLKEYNQSLISSVVTGKVRVTEDMI